MLMSLNLPSSLSLIASIIYPVTIFSECLTNLLSLSLTYFSSVTNLFSSDWTMDLNFIRFLYLLMTFPLSYFSLHLDLHSMQSVAILVNFFFTFLLFLRIYILFPKNYQLFISESCFLNMSPRFKVVYLLVDFCPSVLFICLIFRFTVQSLSKPPRIYWLFAYLPKGIAFTFPYFVLYFKNRP